MAGILQSSHLKDVRIPIFLPVHYSVKCYIKRWQWLWKLVTTVEMAADDVGYRGSRYSCCQYRVVYDTVAYFCWRHGTSPAERLSVDKLISISQSITYSS